MLNPVGNTMIPSEHVSSLINLDVTNWIYITYF